MKRMLLLALLAGGALMMTTSDASAQRWNRGRSGFGLSLNFGSPYGNYGGFSYGRGYRTPYGGYGLPPRGSLRGGLGRGSLYAPRVYHGMPVHSYRHRGYRSGRRCW